MVAGSSRKGNLFNGLTLDRDLVRFRRARPGRTVSARLRRLLRSCFDHRLFTPLTAALVAELVRLAPDRETLRWNLQLAERFRESARPDQDDRAPSEGVLRSPAPLDAATPSAPYVLNLLDEWLIWTTSPPGHWRLSYPDLRDGIPDPRKVSPLDLLAAHGYLEPGKLDLWVDEETRTHVAGDRRVFLQPREVDLLLFLVKHAGRLVPVEVVVAQLWGGYTGPESCYKTLCQLRKKLGQAGLDDLVRSEPWIGRTRAYRLDGRYRVAILMSRARYRYAQLPARVRDD